MADVNGKEFRVRLRRAEGPNNYQGRVNGKQVTVTLEEETESSITLVIDGNRMVFERAVFRPESGGRARASVPENKNDLKSPMPGRIVSLKVKRGERVRVGHPLVVLESMKMESVMVSDRDAMIKEICVKEGDAIQRGQTIIVYEQDSDVQ